MDRREDLRGLVTLAPQDASLSSDTIRESIRHENSEAGDQEVEAAVHLAQAHKFIAGLPQAYESQVGELDATLPGGQRQLVAFAQALMVDPGLLSLAETSANLDEIRRSRTTPIIAHRFSA